VLTGKLTAAVLIHQLKNFLYLKQRMRRSKRRVGGGNDVQEMLRHVR
jgi:hypothetical protein